MGFCVTASLLEFPGLFLVFCPISTMLLFGWSPLIPFFLSPLFPVPVFWWLYLAHQLHLVTPLPSCSIVFFNSQTRSMYLFLYLLYFSFFPVVSQNSRVHYSTGSLFYRLSLGLVVWPRLDDSKEFWVTHFQGRTLGCAFTICLYSQT